jgi:hypothetical protein
MLERHPGMVSKICESFKGLHLMVAGSFHDARAEDEFLTQMVKSDNRLKQTVSAYGGTSSKIPPPSESSRSTTFCHVTGIASQSLKGSSRTRRTASPRTWPTIRAQLMTGEEMGVQALNLLRQAL